MKTSWSASLLMTTKKNQWRSYADAQLEEQTWEQYRDYLLTLLSNPMIRVMNTTIVIENVKQLSRQSIAAFNQYLVKLWDKLKRHVSNEERQERLLTKVHAFIRTKCVRMRDHEVDFYFKLVVNLLIAKQLLVDDDTLDRSSDNATKAGQSSESDQKSHEGGNGDDRSKGREASRNRPVESGNAQENNQNQFSKSQQNQQDEREDENRDQNQNFASPGPGGRTCYACDKSDHITSDFACEKYAQTQERRNQNQNQSSRKGRAWCLPLKHWG